MPLVYPQDTKIQLLLFRSLRNLRMVFGFASKVRRHRQNGYAARCEDGLCPSVSGCPFLSGYAARP
jgi:hypothetical protein